MGVKSPVVLLGLANAWYPGCAKLAKAPLRGPTRRANDLQLPEGVLGGCAQLELIYA